MALKSLLFSFLRAACLVDVGQAENTTTMTTTVTTTTDGITDVGLKVQGQSGKFSLYATAVGESDPNKIVVLMDSLTEVDVDGNAVGASGNLDQRHSIQTFAPQEFAILEPVEEKLGTVNAEKITFSSTVGQIGVIGVDTLIVKGHGIVGPAGEAWEVWPGDLKWNIRFPEWKFCGEQVQCKQGGTSQVGAFLDLDITVKGSATDTSEKAGNQYSLGGGVDLLLTNKVTIDGVEMEMPPGFPRVEMKGGKQVFKFRFPKFLVSAAYDPVLTTSSSESIPGAATTTTGIVFTDACGLLHPGLWSLLVAGLMSLLVH